MNQAPQSPRLPRGWPQGRSLAISVSVMLEGWADDAAPGIGPMGNPLKAGVLDIQGRSWAEYGPKAGAWRLLDILAAKGLKAVFYTSGIVAERHPGLIAEIARQGHSVAGHSWTQNMIPAYLDAEAEKQDIRRCTEVLARAAGTRPLGWISPRCTPSLSTSALLAAEGYRWHADTFDSDLPYALETPSGRLLAMPFTMEINDMPLYIRYGNEPEAYTRILQRMLENWQGLGSTAACLDLTVHAHVFGRPAGAIEFVRSLELVQAHGELAWLTEHASLAGLYGGQA